MRNKTNGYIYYDFHKKTEKEEIAETAWKSVFNWITTIVCLLAVVALVWSAFFRVVRIDGNSMNPALENNDYVVVYTFNYTPVKGDIIVTSSDYDGGIILVKRVVATEGQSVSVDYDNDTVSVDSVVVSDSYAYEKDISSHKDEIEYPHIVEDGHLFLMGDNRNVSRDSRSTEIGDINSDDVLGKVVFRISKNYKVY